MEVQAEVQAEVEVVEVGAGQLPSVQGVLEAAESLLGDGLRHDGDELSGTGGTDGDRGAGSCSVSIGARII